MRRKERWDTEESEGRLSYRHGGIPSKLGGQEGTKSLR